MTELEPFDAILMDLGIPGIGCQAATEQIREGRPNGNVAIIALSADAAQASCACCDGRC